MNESMGIIFIFIGLALDFFGCLGLVRLPDVYNRLQASTKCATLGTAFILFGLFLTRGISAVGFKSLLCICFVFMTAPVSAHALARAAHKNGIKVCNGSLCDKYAEDKG